VFGCGRACGLIENFFRLFFFFFCAIVAAQWEMLMENNRLKAFVERIEKLNEERDAINVDIKEVISEAKSDGFDAKILKKVIALRKMDPAERERIGVLVETYMAAL